MTHAIKFMDAQSVRTCFAIVAIALLSVTSVAFTTQRAHAAEDLEVAGWLPYWRDSEGIDDVEDRFDDIDTIHPFVFSVKSNGSLSDLADIDTREWRRFFDDARDEDVEVIPTIMSSDGNLIHDVLSDDDVREAHIEAIVEMVEDGDFDGVDIDYEGKLAETKNHFSEFLEELKDELGSKLLTCTVEARTPPESLYKVVPANIQRANDYDEMADHCDRIELMTYDQQRADIKLNEERSGEPYMPVADVDWVEKVVRLALKDFDEDQVMLGIPTYGNHYTVSVAPNWYKDYTRIGALNIPDILDIAEEYDVEPGRNKAGEMSITYFPESSVYRLLGVLPVPEGTREGMEAAAQALLFANMTGQTVPVNFASYSDAEAIAEKIELARDFGLRGVALFKFDGEEDQDIWDLLEE